MNTYVYKYGNNLYINLTNRCSNACTFCERNKSEGIGGNSLWLEKEPAAEEVIAALKEQRFEDYDEVVFCGFGEPTYKLDELIEIGKFLKQNGKYVRLNTNGQGSLINGRDITGELAAAVDAVSISLNAPTAKEYQEVCQSVYGEKAFGAMLEFAQLCVPKLKRTVLSAVDLIGAVKIEECRAVCKRAGAEFLVRKHY